MLLATRVKAAQRFFPPWSQGRAKCSFQPLGPLYQKTSARQKSLHVPVVSLLANGWICFRHGTFQEFIVFDRYSIHSISTTMRPMMSQTVVNRDKSHVSRSYNVQMCRNKVSYCFLANDLRKVLPKKQATALALGFPRIRILTGRMLRITLSNIPKGRELPAKL